jgi:nucleotide-binding universal stress UspA family protein
MTAIKSILFPFDFSPACCRLIPSVSALAGRFGASVTALTVAPPPWVPPAADMPPLIGETPEEWKRTLQSRLDERLATEFTGIALTRLADAGDPAIRIAAFASEHNADLIMMPTHGLGTFRTVVIGSVTAKVLHDVHCPVWTSAHTTEHPPSGLPQQILCAIDGTPQARLVLAGAAHFASTVGARLSLLHVAEPITDWIGFSHDQELQDQARHAAQTQAEALRQAVGVDAPLRVAVGKVVDTVVEQARQDAADLIVIGRGAISEPFGRLRTHAFGIVQRAPCPVLSV